MHSVGYRLFWVALLSITRHVVNILEIIIFALYLGFKALVIHSNVFGTVCLVCWVNIAIVLILPRKLAVIHIGREHDLFQNVACKN